MNTDALTWLNVFEHYLHDDAVYTYNFYLYSIIIIYLTACA